jgi:putative two-component system response regulator
VIEDRPSERGILIVDDEDGIREALASFVRASGYPHVVEARNGHEALDCLRKQRFFLVLTDLTMPGMGGLELLSHVRRDYPDVDVAVVTGHLELEFAIQSLKVGAFDFFKKPFRFEEVLATIHRVVEKQHLQRRSLELERLKERRNADESHLKEFMLALAHIIDMKSRYTRQHSDRVSRIAALMSERIGLSKDEIDRIALGARLHDIGKLAIPDCILDKPGPLTADEYAIMKEHPGRGADLCQPIACLAPVVSMIRWHHENLDGTGYPDGLKGEQIPLDARIVRIADYWDAITSNRSYRSPMEPSAAMAVLEQECENGRLDQRLTHVLFDLARAGMLRHAVLLPAEFAHA